MGLVTSSQTLRKDALGPRPESVSMAGGSQELLSQIGLMSMEPAVGVL